MSLEGIYREYNELIRWVLRARGTPEAVLDDLVHDVFVAIHRRLPEREGGVPLRTWIVGVARNVAFSQRRADARRERRIGELPRPPDPPWPDELLARREAWASMARFLDELGPEQREVFVMVELAGMRVSELAETTAVPANTLHSRLKAARARFESRFAEVDGSISERLEQAREGARPDSTRKARTWGLVAASVGGLEIVPSGGALAGAVTNAPWMFGLGKGIAIASGILVSGLVAIAVSQSPASGAGALEPPVHSLVPVAKPSADDAGSRGPDSTRPTEALVEMPTAGTAAARPNTRSQPKTDAEPPLEDPDQALEAAVRAIGRARRELQAGRAAEALVVLDELGARFGALDRERRRIEIDAACRTGDHDRARRAAHALAATGISIDAEAACTDRIEETASARCKDHTCDD